MPPAPRGDAGLPDPGSGGSLRIPEKGVRLLPVEGPWRRPRSVGSVASSNGWTLRMPCAGNASKVDENTVGFFERFLGANVIPKPGQGPGMDRGARVEPLNHASRLVSIVSVFHVLSDLRKKCFGVEVKGNPYDRGGGVLGFFLERGDLPFDIHVDLAVFLGVFQSSHIMNAQHRRFLLQAKGAKILNILAEEIVSCDDHDVFVNGLLFDGKDQVTDGTQPVVFIGRSIVDHFDGQRRVDALLMLGPCMKMIVKSMVGNNRYAGQLRGLAQVLQLQNKQNLVKQFMQQLHFI